MILKSNRVLRFFSVLLLFIAGSINVFATDDTIYDDIDFKSKEQVDQGISNQLDFLINYNSENEKNGKSHENWYVYIVGEDSFDATLFSNPSYVVNELSDIGSKHTPVDVAKLNEKLIEINKSLSEKKLPLIYYGVANKKKAIPAPFFPFEGQYNVSTTDSEKKLLSYYFEKNLKEYGQDEAVKNTNSVLWNFYKNEKDEAQETLLTQTLNMAGKSGAIALSTYYLAFIKSDGNGKAKLLWWSLTGHKFSEAYFKDNPVGPEELKIYEQHYKSLSKEADKNHARINAWYNYLTGADVPDSEFLSEMLANYLNNPKCANLSITEAEKLKKDFIAKIAAEDKDEIIAFTEQLCPAIVLEVDYEYIIKAIKTIAEDRITEKGEAAVLILMYGIKTKDYDSFFTDLKASENNLLNRLLVQMDDASLNPYDKDHYSSFIGQLLYMGYQNNGEYLKKERITLVEALLKYRSNTLDLSKSSIKEPLAKILSFNLSSDESDFHQYLVEDGYKKMLEFISLFTKYQASHLENTADPKMIGDAWGKFFAERNNQEVYIKLLKTAFFNEEEQFSRDEEAKKYVAQLVFRMFSNVPEQPYDLYSYLTTTDTQGTLTNLKGIIKQSFKIDYELYGNIFYDGLTKILDSQGDIKARLEIVKWAIDDDEFWNNTHENMVVNIFKNITSNEDKKQVYNFLTYKNGEKSTGEKTYEYFSKITDEGILSGSGSQTKFVDYYISFIKEGIGSVEDRIGIVKKVVAKGDDWSMLWFSNDTEDLVSSLFNNLNRGDAEYVIGELKGKNGEYELFREIWQTLQSVNVPVWFDRDNSQLSSFATSIGGLLKLTNEETVKAASHYEKYLDKHHNYLSSTPSTISQIDGNYLPMVRANFFNYTDGGNKHKLEAGINAEASKDVNISLEIGGSKVMDKSFDPFEYVFVEFIEDTEVNTSVKFSKGSVIGVPAFYIAWMEGTINSQQNNVAFVVTMDAIVVIVGTAAVVYSGGTLTPFILAATKAEILFAGIHIPLTIYNKEAKETLGEDFVMGLEIAYMITSVATLPEAFATLPKNLITLSTKTKNGVVNAIDYTKGGAIAAGSAIEKITIDIKGFTKALPELLKALKNDPVKKQELFKRISDFESHMRTKMQGFGSSVPAEFKKAYDQLLELTRQFYLANMPAGLASIINKLPSDKLQVTIINKLLTYTFDGKPILGIDAQGILHHVKKYKEAENYTTVVGDFKAKVQLESGEQYETAIEAAKNDKGDVVFRQKHGDDFVEGGDLVTDINNFQARIKAFLDDNVVKRLRNDILASDLQTKFPDLTIEELIAIKLYTNGEKRNGKVIFNTLNSQLRNGKVEEFYEGMDLLLTNSLKKLPQYNSEKVFRGVSGDEANLARTWQKGDEIDFADYKSTSEDMVMAAYYNVDNEVVYEIIDPKGASLSSISYYDNEMEVLLHRGQKFKVIDIQESFQIDEARNLNTKRFTKITLQAVDGITSVGTGVTNVTRSVPDHAWPAPYPPLAAGQVRVADLQRLKLDRITGAFQGEVKEAIVDRKVEEILAILNGESNGKHLPIVKMAPDPNTPGGFVLTDQTHTYAAYKRLGFDEIPASIYNESEGVPFLIRQGVYNTDYYFPINELQTVPEFSGTPAQQAVKRREALEGRIKNETGSIESSSISPQSGYIFEKEGYIYVPKTELQPDGSKRIEHFIEKEGERPKIIGHSTLTENGDLENFLEIPETLKQKGISKAIYAHVLKENVKRILTEYGVDDADKVASDNFTAFMKEYNSSNDKVKAALETPQGKVLGSEWEPINIQVKDNGVHLVWVKKGTGSSVLNEPWINSLPTELRTQLFAKKDEMYDLFKSADANERAKLAKSWEVLRNAAGLYYQPLMVIKLSTIGEKFHYNGIKGFDALKPLFTTYTTGHPDLNLLSKEMDFINKLSELESLFESTNDLPVSFSCVKNATYYDPIVLDGSGDVIIRVEAGNIVKNKFFDKVDASYEKVGEYNGFDILRKGDEIGFKSADIININR